MKILSNAAKSCAPSIESLLPHEKFLHGNILPLNPRINSPPKPKKSPWKRLYTSQ